MRFFKNSSQQRGSALNQSLLARAGRAWHVLPCRGTRRGESSAFGGLEQLESRQLLATVYWNGLTSDFQSPANWSGGAVPGPLDDVVIADLLPGGMVFSGLASVRSITCDAPFSVSGGFLEISEPSVFNGLLTQNVGEIGGTGDLTITAAMNWGGGSLLNGDGGDLHIEPGALLNINHADALLGGRLFNEGTVTTLAGTHVELTLAANTGIINSGTWTSHSLELHGGTSAYPILLNQGEFVLTGAGLSQIFIDAGSGTALWNEGQIEIQSGASLRLYENGRHYTGSTIAGDGTLELVDTVQTMEDPVTWSVATVQMSGFSNILGDALSIAGDFEWIGGNMAGTGALTILPGATLAFTDPLLSLGRPLVNLGSVTQTGSQILVNASASITNEGQWAFNSGEIDGDGGIALLDGTFIWSGGAIAGSGSFTISPDAALNITAPTATLNRSLINLGTVTHISGASLSIGSGGAVTTSGSWNLLSGAITGPGNFAFNGGTFDWTGGTITGSGTFTVGPAATLFGGGTIARSLINHGTVQLDGPSTLALTGSANENHGNLLVLGAGTLDLSSGSMSHAAGSQIFIDDLGQGGASLLLGSSTQTILAGSVTWTLGDNAITSGTITGPGDLRVVGNTSLSGGTFTGSGKFEIDGSLRITDSLAFGRPLSLYAASNPDALLIVDPGVTLALTVDPANLVGGTLLGGRWIIDGTLTLPMGSQVTTLDAIVAINGPAASFPAISSLSATTAAAAITIQSGADLAITPTGGALTNAGSLFIYASSSLSITGSFANSATGDISTSVSGTNPATDYGLITATGPISLGGSFTATPLFGFMPTLGQTFTFISGSARSGTFSSTSFPAATGGLTTLAIYDADSFSMAALSVVAWDGGPTGLGTNFHDPANWVGDVPPGANDTAYISVAANPTITITANATIGGLISDEAITQTGGVFTINSFGDFSALYTLSGGTLTGSGDLTFNGGLTWTNGTLAGSGLAIIPAGQTLDRTGGWMSRSIDVFGTFNLSGGGIFAFDSGRILTIKSGGTLNHSGGTQISGQNATPTVTIVNEGVYNVMGTGGAFANNLSFTNAAGGVVNVQSGTLDYGANGTFINAGAINGSAGTDTLLRGFGSSTATYLAGSMVTSAGNVYLGATTGTVESGASFSVSGTFYMSSGTTTFQPGSILTINGPYTQYGGILSLNTGGTITFPQLATMAQYANFTPQGAIFTRLTGSDDFIFAGGLTFGDYPGDSAGGGILAGTGTAYIPAGQVLTRPQEVLSIFLRNVELLGTANFGLGLILVGEGATFYVRPDSVMNIDTGAGIIDSGSFSGYYPGSGAIVNEGTLNKLGTGTFNIRGDNPFTFTNAATGAVNVQGGAFQFYPNSGSLSNHGLIEADTGTSVYLAGLSMTLTADSVLNSLGNVNLGATAGTIQSGASFSVGGTLSMSGGTTTFQPGSLLAINGPYSQTGGTLSLNTGGPVTFPQPATMWQYANYTPQGAIFTRLTGSDDFIFAGGLTFADYPAQDTAGGGILAGTGTAYIPVGQTLTSVDNVLSIFLRNVELLGTANFGLGLILVGEGATFYVRPDSVMNIDTGAGIIDSGSFSGYYPGSGAIVNEGTLNKLGTGTFNIRGDNPFTFTNAATGAVNVQGGAFQFYPNSGSLSNHGLIEADAGTYMYLAGSVQNHLTDSILSSAGTIELGGGTASFHSGSTVTVSGQFRMYAGATTFQPGSIVFINGPYNQPGGTAIFNTGSAITFTSAVAVMGGSLTFSAGTPLTFQSAVSVTGATVTFSTGTPIAFPALFTLSGGTVTGTDDLAFNGGLVFNDATLSGTGSATIPAGQVLTMNAGTRAMSRTFEMFGTTNWSSGYIRLNGGQFVNREGAVFNVSVGGPDLYIWAHYGQGPSVPGTFLNEGTFNKSGTGAAYFTYGSLSSILHWTNGPTGVFNVDQGIMGVQALGAISNAGTFNVDTGAVGIFFFTPAQISSSTLTGGTWNVGGTLTFPVGTTITTIGAGASVQVSGPAAAINKSGGGSALATLATNDGTLTLHDGAPWGFKPAGDIFANNGTFNITGIGTVTVPPHVTFNNGAAGVLGGTLNIGDAMRGPGPVIEFGPFEGGGTINISGTVAFNQDFEIFAIVNLFIPGTLTGTGNILITGTFNWFGGLQSGTGSTSVGSGNTLNMFGDGVMTLSREMNNLVAGSWTGGCLLLDGGQFANSMGATFTISGTVEVLSTGSGDESFSNAGSMALTSGSDVTFGTDLAVSNSGSLIIEALCIFEEDEVFDGTVELVTGGEIAGPGNLTFLFGFVWTGGTMSGTGTTIIDAAATLLLGNGNMTLSRTIENFSVAGSWTGGCLLMAGGIFNNNAGASLDIFADPRIDVLGISGTNEFNNHGLITVHTGEFVIGVPGVNTGTIIVIPPDTLIFMAPWIYMPGSSLEGPGGVIFGGGMHSFPVGTFSITGPIGLDTGASLVLPASSLPNYNAATNTFTGGSWTIGSGAQLFLNGADIRTIGLDTTFTLMGDAQLAALANLSRIDGSLHLEDGALLAINPDASNAALINNGHLRIGPGSTLDIAGAYQQAALATLHIGIAGTSNAQMGRLVMTGSAALDGSFELTYENAFAASRGEEFRVISSSGTTGAFSMITAPPPPAGNLKAPVLVDALGVRLIVTHVADWNNDLVVDVPDIFNFLTAWFAGDAAAQQFGGSPGVPAIFAFLTAWFAA